MFILSLDVLGIKRRVYILMVIKIEVVLAEERNKCVAKDRVVAVGNVEAADEVL